MSYTYADVKPNRTLINYNTVRGAELKLLHGAINGMTNVRGLKRFARRQEDQTYDDGHVETCLKFLHAVDFLERPEDRVVEPINEDVFPELSFEAKLLHHLRRQEPPQDHFTRIHDVALASADQTVTREQLVTNLDRELEHEIDWNVTKMNMWYRLMEPLGVVTYIDDRELVLSPSRALLYELLETFQEKKNSSDFAEAIAWIEENFVSVLVERPGTPRLHRGVADTVHSLVDDDVLDLRSMSDAQRTVVLPSVGSTSGNREVKEFTLAAAPEPKPASYRYPLAKQEVI